jgi:hypothetical protein
LKNGGNPDEVIQIESENEIWRRDRDLEVFIVGKRTKKNDPAWPERWHLFLCPVKKIV